MSCVILAALDKTTRWWSKIPNPDLGIYCFVCNTRIQSAVSASTYNAVALTTKHHISTDFSCFNAYRIVDTYNAIFPHKLIDLTFASTDE